MFKTQIKWKLGALLLAAPFLLSTVAHADEELKLPAKEMPSRLKGYKWQAKDGEVYLFYKDGTFEARPSTKFAKSYTFVKDLGRFTVRPVADDDTIASASDNYMLQLNINSSVEKPKAKGGKSKVIERTVTRALPIKLMLKKLTHGYDMYAVIDGKRFDDVRKLP